MRRDPYSDVMGEYGSSDSHLSEQLEKQLASIEDEEELKEIIREARKNAEIRKELEQNNVYRQKIYKRIIGYDQEKKKAENPTKPKPGSAMDSLVSNQPKPKFCPLTGTESNCFIPFVEICARFGG